MTQLGYCTTMKAIEYESDIEVKGSAEDVGEAKGNEPGAGEKPIGVGEGGAGGVVKETKGTSVTLQGCGRRDGSDIDNSMSLAAFYRLMFTGSCK